MKDPLKHACSKPIAEGGHEFTLIELPFNLKNVYHMSVGIGDIGSSEVNAAYVEFCMVRDPDVPMNIVAYRKEAQNIMRREAERADAELKSLRNELYPAHPRVRLLLLAV